MRATEATIRRKERMACLADARNDVTASGEYSAPDSCPFADRSSLVGLGERHRRHRDGADLLCAHEVEQFLVSLRLPT